MYAFSSQGYHMLSFIAIDLQL